MLAKMLISWYDASKIITQSINNYATMTMTNISVPLVFVVKVTYSFFLTAIDICNQNTFGCLICKLIPIRFHSHTMTTPWLIKFYHTIFTYDGNEITNENSLACFVHLLRMHSFVTTIVHTWIDECFKGFRC